MAGSIYTINKGVSRSLEFKGFRAQYIGYLCAGVVGLLILFAVLYLFHVAVVSCFLITSVSAVAVIGQITSMNKKFGTHGLMKKNARKRVPKVVVNRTKKNHERIHRHNTNMGDRA